MGEFVIELREIRQDAPLVQLVTVLHVSSIKKRGNIQLLFSNGECQLAIPEHELKLNIIRIDL